MDRCGITLQHQVMKGFTSNPAGAWATGGNLNTARSALGGAGIQNAALVLEDHQAFTYGKSNYRTI